MKEERIVEKLNSILPAGLTFSHLERRKEAGVKILTIYIDGKYDVEVLALLHKQFLKVLDDSDIDEDYYLELSSVAHEIIIDLNEASSIGKYVEVYSVIDEDKVSTIGTIMEVDNDYLTLKVNQKGRFSNLKIERENIDKVIERDKY